MSSSSTLLPDRPPSTPHANKRSLCLGDISFSLHDIRVELHTLNSLILSRIFTSRFTKSVSCADELHYRPMRVLISICRQSLWNQYHYRETT